MLWFHKKCRCEKDVVVFSPVSPDDSNEDLQARVDRLADDEYEIYKWLREFYSERWIAETLLINRCEAKGKIKQIYYRLGVRDKKMLIRVYSRLGRPRKRSLDTEEIDSFVDERMEKEIQGKLNEKNEGGD